MRLPWWTIQSMEEMTLSIMNIKEALDTDHNYHCASSSKALKLALDTFLQTEEKLLKRLRNVKKRESRLTDRVCWLVIQLERKQMHEQPDELHQPCPAGTGPGRKPEDHNQENSPVTLHQNRALQKDKDALRCSQKEITSKKHKSLSEHELSPSSDCEASSRKQISSCKQLSRHTQEAPSTFNRCGSILSEAPSLNNNQNTYSEELTTGVHPNTLLESSKCLKQSATVTRKQLGCTRGKLFQCRECGKSYSFLKSLRVHQHKHPVTASIKKEPNLDTQTPGDIKPVCGAKTEKRHQCSECGKIFSRKKYAARHEKVHTEEKPHTCTICGKSFSQVSHRIQHEKAHTKEKTYKCSECGKSFRGAADLKRHCRTHSGEKPFQCSECGKSFSLSDYLKVHQKIHTGETRCICSECGKCFSRVSYLKTHNRIHTGEKPYTCPECGKSFIDTLRLSRHQLTHKGKKLFQCTECGKSFTSKINVTRHEKKHADMQMAEERNAAENALKGDRLYML